MSTATDYAELFREAIADRKTYRAQSDARVHIFGLLEARLQWVDRLVLGGLVEGVWPPETRGDPWLSRPMRHDLGLDLPERRIGLSAHDFAQAPRRARGHPQPRRQARRRADGCLAFCAAARRGRGKERWDAALERGAHYAALARRLDEPAAPKAATRPAPTPAFEARPRRLSVTEIEDLLRDPYTIYARHVLKLTPLDEIDTAPSAADRGTVIHDSIAEFDKTFPTQLPNDPMRALTEIGEKHFKPLCRFPRGARLLVAALPAHRAVVCPL